MSKAWLIVVSLAACQDRETKVKPAPETVPPTPVASKALPVEAGWFASGCVELPPGTKRYDAVQCLGGNPPRRLWVSAFEIDELEVSVEQYSACVAAKVCSAAIYKDYQETPTTPALVRFDQAASYCAWRGQRLPTEAEWEKAARGTDGRMYPWGNERPTCQTAALTDDAAQPLGPLECKRRLASVGTHPQDRSPYGALDMAGNAPEWAADLRVDAKGDWKDFQVPGVMRFADANVVDPTGPTAEARAAHLRLLPESELVGDRVMRGGLNNAAVGVRSRSPLAWETCEAKCDVPVAGFRCARTSASATAPPSHPPVPEATIDATVDSTGNVRIQSTAL